MEGDVLGAASLLATAVAILYSVWSPEVAAALALDRTQWPQVTDRAAPVGQISSVLRLRAWPLAAVAAVQVLILLPNAWLAIADSFSAAASGGAHYDAVRAAFLAVWAAVALLAWASADQAWRLWRHLADFRKAG
jgi:hypothetical protein